MDAQEIEDVGGNQQERLRVPFARHELEQVAVQLQHDVRREVDGLVVRVDRAQDVPI